MTPAGGITSEVYREQAQRIEELERENKRLTGEVEENQSRWTAMLRLRMRRARRLISWYGRRDIWLSIVKLTSGTES
jgi:predicted RNase H-like nuclease (RuvC/YqgF family)